MCRPDLAHVRVGVTSRAKSAKDAVDANSKTMTAVTAALLDAGIAQKDIQTSQFSIQPVYAPPEPRTEPKLSGYSASNQVIVKTHQIAKLGDILDRLVTAGATDVGNVQFLLADPSKALDQAREAAVADARRKAELYARASGLTLRTDRMDHRRPWLHSAYADESHAGSSRQVGIRAHRHRRGHATSADHCWLRYRPIAAATPLVIAASFKRGAWGTFWM